MKGGEEMRKLSKEKKFYVYAWYIKESGDVFYIGKGCADRYKKTSNRTSRFKEVYDKNICIPTILAQNLTEKEAFKYEEELIAYYKGKYPDNILTNQRNGGEHDYGWDAPQEYRDKMREKVLGKNNPNYGNRWSDEQKERLSRLKIEKELSKGENNGRATPIMCLETGDYFKYIGLAAETYGIKNQMNFYPLYTEPWRTAGGYHWVKILDNETLEFFRCEENRKDYIIQAYASNPNNKAYIDRETGEIFKSRKYVLKKLNVGLKYFNKYIAPEERYVKIDEYYGRTCQ